MPEDMIEFMEDYILKRKWAFCKRWRHKYEQMEWRLVVVEAAWQLEFRCIKHFGAAVALEFGMEYKFK